MKKTRKLIVPIALLVLAVMAVTSTTFAWFTTNATVKGSTIGAKITESEELLWMVGVEKTSAYTVPGNWTTNITENLGGITGYKEIKMEDLTYLREDDMNLKAGDNTTDISKYELNTGNGGYDLVDGAYVVNGSGNGDYDKVGVAADGLYTKGGGTTTANAQFIEFTYHFWNSSVDSDLKVDLKASSLTSTLTSTRRFGTSEYYYLESLFNAANNGLIANGAGGVATADVVAFFATKTLTQADNGTTDEDTYKADYKVFNDGTNDWYFKAGNNGIYSVDANNAARVMFTTDGQSTSGTGSTRTLWNPGFEADSSYDLQNFDVQDLYRLVQGGARGVLPAASYDPYDGNGIDMDDIDYITDSDVSVPLTKFESNATHTTVINGGTTYYHASVKITIWLEGWDSDCFNVILNSDIKTSFQFSV